MSYRINRSQIYRFFGAALAAAALGTIPSSNAAEDLAPATVSSSPTASQPLELTVSSEMTAPIVVDTLGGVGEGIDIDGGIVAFGAGRELVVAQVVGGDTTITGRVCLPGLARGVAVHSTNAAVGYHSGVVFVDLADPSDPSMVSAIDVAAELELDDRPYTTDYSLKVWALTDTHAYVTYRSSSIAEERYRFWYVQAIDVTELSRPSVDARLQITTWPDGTTVDGLRLSGGKLLLLSTVHGMSMCDAKLTSLGVPDMAVIDSLDVECGHAIHAAAGKAYLQVKPLKSLPGILHVVGVSPEGRLTSLSETAASGEIVGASGSIVFMAEEDGLRLDDFSDPQRPEALARISTDEGTLHGFAVSGVHAIRAQRGQRYLSVDSYDVSQPQAPAASGSIAAEMWSADDVAASGSRVFVRSGYRQYGSAVYVRQTPRYGEPLTGGSWVEGQFGRMVAAGDRLITWWSSGAGSRVEVLDASEPQKLQELGSHEIDEGRILDVAVARDLVFVAVEDREVLELRIAPDGSIDRFTTIGSPGVRELESTEAGLLFGLTDESVLAWAVDVTPYPELVGRFDYPDRGLEDAEMGARGSIAALANAQADRIAPYSLDLVDFAEHSTPQLVGRVELEWGFGVAEVLLTDRLALLAHGSGVLAFDISSPENPSVLGTVAIGTWPRRMVQTGDRVLLAAGDGGLVSLGISIPGPRAFLPAAWR